MSDRCPTDIWQVSDRYLTVVRQISDRCPTDVWQLPDRCPIDVWQVSERCPTRVRHSDRCPTFWQVSDRCPTEVGQVSNRCPTDVWQMSDRCLYRCPTGTLQIPDRCSPDVRRVSYRCPTGVPQMPDRYLYLSTGFFTKNNATIITLISSDSRKLCSIKVGFINFTRNCIFKNYLPVYTYISQDGFGGLVVSMLASGTQGRGFKPGRIRWIFTNVKILSMSSFGGEVKESVPCPSFAAWERT
jgi:hypothetical protein